MSERIMGAEAHWLMGRVMPREFLEEVSKYLHHVAPERDDELMTAVKARAGEIAEATKDLAVDGRSEGPLAICAVVLVSYETLLPLFNRDERRAIFYLQHAMGPVLRRPYDLMFSTLNERKDPLDKIEKACRKTVGIYPAYFEFDFQRPGPGLFEMNIRRCFFRDFFDRHHARLVTTVMCAFDVNFMKAIDPSVSGLRGERTSLLRSETSSAGSRSSRPTTPSPDTPTSSTSDSSTSSNPADTTLSRPSFKRKGGLA